MIRKGAHTFVYFVLGLLWIWCFSISWLLIIPALACALDEVSKPWLKNSRHADFFEWCLGELGLALAVAAWAIF